MHLNALPFDADKMLQGLRPWIECESPTWEPRAVVMGASSSTDRGPCHTLEEHITVESLSRRGRLMARLLTSLGA